jgi:hypothetical protein
LRQKDQDSHSRWYRPLSLEMDKKAYRTRNGHGSIHRDSNDDEADLHKKRKSGHAS